MNYSISVDNPALMFLSLINDFVKLTPKEREFVAFLMDYRGIADDTFKVKAKNKFKLSSAAYAQLIYNLSIKNVILKTDTFPTLHQKLILPDTNEITVNFKILKK